MSVDAPPPAQLIDTRIGRDCPRCPRLVAFRHSLRSREPTWHNAPVPSFGPVTARLLIVGLAPGLQGANRTGRPFTGDYAGDLLYATLLRFGFAAGEYAARPDDGLQLVDARITNAVRCVPPENKPAGEEIRQCRYFLKGTIAEMPNLKALVLLGRIAHDSAVPSPCGLAVRTWRATRSRRAHALRQLSLLALQYQYRRADPGHVPRDF